MLNSKHYNVKSYFVGFKAATSNKFMHNNEMYYNIINSLYSNINVTILFLFNLHIW